MSHPYQCLCHCPQASQFETGILVGASGSRIHTFSAQNGRYLSTWPHVEKSAQSQLIGRKSETDSKVSNLDDSPQDEVEPPTKRQKLSLVKNESSSSSAEIVVTGESDNNEFSSLEQPSNLPVIKLAGTSNGQRVIAVTGEDKCIRVFDLAADGTLTQFSERCMPKKPCAVALTPDDSTILCADKFGDVYSLPLAGQACKPETVYNADANGTIGMGNHKQKERPFAPSATSLTVHTKRNRDALRQQQKIKTPKEEKKALSFEHKYLLGHVSLLTDVKCVNLVSPSQKPRNYIITSDRDEHIRVSRGGPQAHIIDGYCLGHTEFITKLCVPPVYSHLLISGGGDDYLILWNWHTGEKLQQLGLKSLVTNVRDTHFQAGGSIEDTESQVDSALRICVSNIQALATQKTPDGHPRIEVIVTCEGVPAIFSFTLGEKGHMQFNTSIYTESNVIDLTVLRKQESVMYSMDTFHQAFSTHALADTGEGSSRNLVGAMIYCAESKSWKVNEVLQANLAVTMRECADSNPDVPRVEVPKGSSLVDLLYGLEGLRKRGSENERIE